MKIILTGATDFVGSEVLVQRSMTHPLIKSTFLLDGLSEFRIRSWTRLFSPIFLTIRESRIT